MDLDDLEPRDQPRKPKNLDVMSLDELEAYIVAMEAEIARVRAAIAAKQDHRSSADSFFKS